MQSNVDNNSTAFCSLIQPFIHSFIHFFKVNTSSDYVGEQQSHYYYSSFLFMSVFLTFHPIIICHNSLLSQFQVRSIYSSSRACRRINFLVAYVTPRQTQRTSRTSIDAYTHLNRVDFAVFSFISCSPLLKIIETANFKTQFS